MINNYECWYCNNEVPLRQEPQKRVVCDKCFGVVDEEKNEVIKEYNRLKKVVMFENAINLLEKAKLYMHEYKKSAGKVYASLISSKFDYKSSHEVATAIILHDYNYEFKVNHSILNYKVDFYIPELKVCLEIDGRLHKHSKLYDNSRDIEIRNELGKQWEVIRIPTALIEKKPTFLIDTIEMLYNKKKELRCKNNGILPEHYSQREKTHYNNILFGKM